MDLKLIEKALTYALEAKLGKRLKPLTTGGLENKKDVEAIHVLIDLRNFLGIKKESSPPVWGAAPAPQDSPPSH